MVNSLKDTISLQIKGWTSFAFSSNGLIFLNAKGNIPICSPGLTFKYLFFLPLYVELHLSQAYSIPLTSLPSCHKGIINIFLKSNKAFPLIRTDLLKIRMLVLLNPLQPGVAFLYPLKTSENLKVFLYFQGV